jgi:hypothetical protein
LLLKAFVPVIVIISLKNITDLHELAKAMRRDFESTYHTFQCARQDVYERNIEDGILYIQDHIAKIDAKAEEIAPAEEINCEDAEYSVYREANERLDLLYPNWTFLETLSSPIER